MLIYLAGGFVSGWQDEVIAALSGLEHVQFFDPREHKLHDPRDYTKRDLKAIDECDMVFAHMEPDNPGWPNLAFEVGYAHHAGKKIVLVNQKRRRYAEMLHVVSESFASLEAALTALPKMEELR